MASRPERLILASASTARAALLRGAGLTFQIEPASIDESIVKSAARAAGGSAADCALALAAGKALAISRHHPRAFVIGADQVLAMGDEWFDKPVDLAAAAEQLRALRGRSHVLETAVCLAKGGVALWHAVSRPELLMREFSDAFLDGYIAAEGSAVLGSVGAYRLEGMGVQLFARITGDYFATLGLPLIELLNVLRDRGVIAR
jgi:septum formation protein